MDVTGAGKGCGKCRDFLECLNRDIMDYTPRTLAEIIAGDTAELENN